MIQSIIRLIRKTTLTPVHVGIGICTLLLYSVLMWVTHPLGLRGTIVFCLVAGLWSVFIEPRWVQRRDFTHIVERVELNPQVKIAVIGDLHIGSPYATLDALQNLLDNITADEPDILVLVGDYVIQGVIGGTHVHISHVVEILNSVSIPCVAIIGNHDVKDGRKEIRNAFANSNITFLENQHCKVHVRGQDITFIGLDDESTGNPDPRLAFPSDLPGHTTICLAHDPATFLREMPYKTDLCLAGHTHAGQVRIPVVGALVLPGKSPLHWSYGWIETANGPLYVTSGFGTSIAPIRFCAPPEYVFINLGSSEQSMEAS